MCVILTTRVITAQSIITNVNNSPYVIIGTNPLSVRWLEHHPTGSPVKYIILFLEPRTFVSGKSEVGELKIELSLLRTVQNGIHLISYLLIVNRLNFQLVNVNIIYAAGEGGANLTLPISFVPISDETTLTIYLISFRRISSKVA